jgi:Lon protease-like protein
LRVSFLEQYRSPSDLPARIPVFPLLGAIALPRTTLPLNVFEPRYLTMIDDVLRGERIVGIIQPTGDGGSTGSPSSRTAPLQAVGCATRLSAFQEQSDGRLLITLTGICRFDVSGEAESDTPYRKLSVAYDRFADDLVAARGAEDVPRARLLAVLQRYLQARNLKPDWEAIEQSENEDLVNGLAIAGPFAPPEKQALLEASTLADRAAALIALAEMELASPAGKPGSRLQ